MATKLSRDALAAQCVADPLKFVLLAYPWGEPGTELADHPGPDQWQVEVLEHVRQALHAPKDGAIRIAIASGHGIGKGACTAWLVQWYLTTRPHPQVVVTANTQAQLITKTWRELALWHGRSLFRDWFAWTKTSYYKVDAQATWFAAAIPWSEHRPEAFQGTHARHVLVIFDEASAIADPIYEVVEGAMTGPEALWVQWGNPTRNTGRFRESFAGGRFAHRWWTKQIDSRTARMTDKGQLGEWVRDYGEDSDFVRIRVKGEFPRAASTQLIGEDVIRSAQQRQPVDDKAAPTVIGVDVARYGDDRSVILVRKGGQILATRVYRELSTVQLAGFVVEAIQEFKPQAVFIDTVGIGAGVYDQVRALGFKAIEANVGLPATDIEHYYNKRAECWVAMKAWLTERGGLDPKDQALPADLTGIEYGYDIKGRLQLERKEDMKKRGLASPDLGDALALSFYAPVAPLAKPERPGAGGLWDEGGGRRGSKTSWMS
jgi:hypothetical protein